MKSKAGKADLNKPSTKTSAQLPGADILFHENEDRFLIDSLPVAVYTCDKEGYIRSYNNAAVELWGRKPEIGKDLWSGSLKMYNPDGTVLPTDECAMALTLKKGKAVTGREIIVERPDGSRRYILPNPQPLYDKEGKLSGAINTLLDITEIKSSQHSSNENEEKLRVAIDAASLGTFNINLLTDEIEYSERYLEIYGFNADERPARSEVIDKLFPDDKITRLNSFKEALVTGLLEYEARVMLSDNQMRWIRVKGKIIFDTNKKAVRTLGTVADITERKESEDKLAKLAAIVQSSEDAIIGKRLDGIITSWNSAAERIFGHTADEMIGFSIYKLIPESSIDEEKEIIRLLRKGERIKHFETKRLRKDGTLIDISLTVSPIKDKNGNIIGASKIARDITAQKEIERLISENEQRLNITVEAAEMGTWELNLKTNDVVYSKRYLEILGFDPSDSPLHSEIIMKVHPDDMPLRNRLMKEALKTGLLDIEMRILTDEGKKIKWIRAKGRVFYDDEKKPVKMMGTALDITKEKKNSEELRKNEEKFRLLADSMPQLVWTSDPHGNLNYFNQSVYDYSGLTTEAIDKDGWLQIVHPDDREENIEKWVHAITTGNDFLLEHRFRKHNGEYRWQLSRAIPQRDSNDKIQMWVGTSTDIHEIKESEYQKDLFISMASHELKTPITSIKGYVQILMSMHNNSSDEFLKNSLTTVNKQIGILTNLIGDLLDLSKIKTGSLQLNKEKFCMNTMVQEVITNMRHTEPAYDFIFTPENECTLYADRERIGQVLINFLTNAIKYSPNSTVINIKSAILDGHALVSVEDKGIGINKVDQKKIFDRFYRVEGKDEKTFPGFGIGLFIASEIIQRHEGKIKVDSVPGQGSTFSFLLPLQK